MQATKSLIHSQKLYKMKTTQTTAFRFLAKAIYNLQRQQPI